MAEQTSDAAATGNGEFGGYAESMAEIDAILASLEDDDMDIDALASKVERASLLIAHCGAAPAIHGTVVAGRSWPSTTCRLPTAGPDRVRAGVDRGSWWALPRSTCASRVRWKPGAHARIAAVSARSEWTAAVRR